MCVGFPSKIIGIEDHTAVIEVLEAQRKISLLLLNENVKVGDYVIVHAGFAIQKIQEEDAKENLRLMKKMFGVEDEFTTVVSQTKNRGKKTRTGKEKAYGKTD